MLYKVKKLFYNYLYKFQLNINNIANHNIDYFSIATILIIIRNLLIFNIERRH